MSIEIETPLIKNWPLLMFDSSGTSMIFASNAVSVPFTATASLNLTAAKKLAASGDKQALQAEVHYLKEIIKQTEARLKETKALAVQFDYAFYQEQDFQYAAKEAYTQTRKMFTWK